MSDNPLSDFIFETTEHILKLHEQCRDLYTRTDQLFTVAANIGETVTALRDRVKNLEDERDALKKEIEQISLLN